MAETGYLVMPTEVYSRIVGYYRPVQNWNEGKKQEFMDRKSAAPEDVTEAAANYGVVLFG